MVKGSGLIERPDSSEYAEYYELYVSKVPEGDILTILDTQIEDTMALLRDIGEDKSKHRYAPDKWSIKQVVGHLAEIELVFLSRALWFARGNTTPLPSLEQDDFVEAAKLANRWDLVNNPG